jgi:hypothetical protein
MTLTDTQLIAKVKELRHIEPKKEWVSFNKRSILGEEPRVSFLPYFKPAFAFMALAFILCGGVGYAFVKSSLPGDVLYVLRKTVHDGQAIFVSDDDKPAFQLGLANDRLDDLAKASARNLEPTMDEFQNNIMEAAKSLSKMNISTSSPEVMQKIVRETKKLEENKQKVESLGIYLSEEETAEFENIFEDIVDRLIIDLENSVLDEEKANLLVRMKELISEGKHSDALEMYLISQ